MDETKEQPQQQEPGAAGAKGGLKIDDAKIEIIKAPKTEREESKESS